MAACTWQTWTIFAVSLAAFAATVGVWVYTATGEADPDKSTAPMGWYLAPNLFTGIIFALAVAVVAASRAGKASLAARLSAAIMWMSVVGATVVGIFFVMLLATTLPLSSDPVQRVWDEIVLRSIGSVSGITLALLIFFVFLARSSKACFTLAAAARK